MPQVPITYSACPLFSKRSIFVSKPRSSYCEKHFLHISWIANDVYRRVVAGRAVLKAWKEQEFTQKPNSILVISGHWETDVPTVNVVHQNDIIYDFDNFPEQMYKLKYPAPGAPEMAKRVNQLLTESGFNRVNEDTKRGLDHGAWVPLMLMYPEDNIPVCQLSVQTKKDGTHHYNMGKALAPLKDEDVLISGSGHATHNLSDLRFGSDSVASWALEFDNWLRHALLQGRYGDVNHYEQTAPNAKTAHPWPDHFYPLHVAMGALAKMQRQNSFIVAGKRALFLFPLTSLQRPIKSPLQNIAVSVCRVSGCHFVAFVVNKLWNLISNCQCHCLLGLCFL